MTDSIADMLTRLRNAAMARQDQTEVPLSRLKMRIAALLKEEGFLSDYRVEERKLVLFLRYSSNRSCAFAGIKRASRPGRRWYVGYQDIPKVHNGLGLAVLSTSRGVMTDRSARSAKVGGEVLFEVW